MRLHLHVKNGILFFKRMPFFVLAKKLRRDKNLENLILRYENDVLTAKLAGELDHHLAAEIRTKIDEEMMAKLPKKLVLELSEIEFMDSSGLGLILGRYTKALEIGCLLVLRNPGRRIKRLIEISGVASMIQTEETKTEEKKND